jgi:hypothetical protein
MSRYFTRLAQRTGLTAAAGRVSAAAHRTEAVADIIEHDQYVDATPPPVSPSAPVVSPASRVSAPQSVARETAGPMLRSSAADMSVGEMVEARQSPDTVARSNGERTTTRPTVTDKPQLQRVDRPHRDAPGEISVRRETPSNTPFSAEGDETYPPARSIADRPSATASAADVLSNASLDARALERERMSVPSRARQSASEPSERPANVADVPQLFSENLLSPPPRQDRDARSSAPLSTKTPSASPSVEKNVEVRIGAVRLEIHAPPVSMPSAHAPPSSSATEPRRFSPSRYHLRG